MSKEHIERYYRLREASDLPWVKALHLSTRALERALARGDLASYKPGLYRLVSESDLRDYIENSRTPASR